VSKRFALAFGCLLLVAFPHGAQRPPGTGLEQHPPSGGGIKTIEAAFVQTRTLKILSHPWSHEDHGYRRPSDLRWEYRSPLQTLLVVRAGNVQRLIRHVVSGSRTRAPNSKP